MAMIDNSIGSKLGGAGFGQVGYAGEQAVKQQAMSMLEEAVSLIEDAASAANKSADALCGPVPECPATAQGMTVASGVFDRIEELARRLRGSANGITSDMHRILNRL